LVDPGKEFSERAINFGPLGWCEMRNMRRLKSEQEKVFAEATKGIQHASSYLSGFDSGFSSGVTAEAGGVPSF